MQRRILLVDDDALIRTGLCLLFGCNGYLTEEAENGNQAIQLVKQVIYSLIIMDFNMPDMNGIDCTRRIRELELITSFRIPIIGFSSDQDLFESCINAGMDDFIHKECTDQELLDKVKIWCL